MSDVSTNTSELIEEIIRMSDFSYERLPMLDIIGGRLASFLPVSLSELTQNACEASLTQLDYVPLGQAISAFPERSLIAIASSPVLDGEFLVVMDAPLILSSLETSLGGELHGYDLDAPEEFTAIECGFSKRLANLILAEIRQSFSVIGDIVPEIDRVEAEPEAAAITQQANLCVRMNLGLTVGNQLCRLLIIFPYDTLEPIRPQLSKVYLGERGDEESPWREILSKQIESATVELEVVLTEIPMTMRQIMAMEPGETFDLSVEQDSECAIFCSQAPVFRCVTGTRKNGIAAVQITDYINFMEEA